MKIKKVLKTICAGAFSALLAAGSVSAATGTVTADLLRVRTAPSMESDTVDMLGWGQTVTITYEPSPDWYEVYLNGGCYYMSSHYITKDGGSASDTYSNTDSYSSDSYESYDTYDADSSSDDSNTTSTSGTYLGNFALTAYCGCASCCGTAGNLTASGTVPTAGRTVAMGGVPFGTKLLINGNVYTVEDRGTSYGVVDIFFNTHAEACAFGMQYADVYEVY